MRTSHSFLLALLIVMGGGPVRAQVLTGKKPIVPVPDRKIRERLSPADEQKHFQVPEGFEVELVAAEPLIINPITLATDDKGRIYVSESHTYRYGPSGSPVKPFRNPVVRLDPLPDGKGYKRTLVADGFDDPVMGMAIRGGKLWLSANNYLYLYDLADDGKATNRRTLLTDASKAWNPFGMFVVEIGPDGLIYMSVGNHGINIGGPTNRVTSRGGSGIIMRMNPDGSNLERLVHGLRVPYSFEMDPFGQLWLLSNGEGNPDRFVRVIEGVDYQCYSRSGVDNTWLAGEHPLAPPCFELGRGASTQLMRYYGAAFPASYQGSLLGDNWGAHGFNGPNRAVIRFVPDDRGAIVRKEGFVANSDPHFRASHILLDPDGNLLIADWYGRDDESDMTGRLWRVKYKGTDRPVVKHKLDATEWKQDDYALSALASPHHLIRAKATDLLVERKPTATISNYAATSKEPLGAAHALWVLARISTQEAKTALASGAKNPDARVRRLAIELLRRYQMPSAVEIAQQLAKDNDPAVLVAAALTLKDSGAIRAALRDALSKGAASDDHLRYEAAWHLAKSADKTTFAPLLKDSDKNIRRAGLIAIDVACFEAFPSKADALATLGQALETPPHVEDLDHLLTLARLNWDKSLAPGVEKLMSRADTPTPDVARAMLLMRSKSVDVSPALMASAGKRLIEAVDKGEFALTTADRVSLYLEFLEAEGAKPGTLKQLGHLLATGPGEARFEAHRLARRFGTKAETLAEALWPRLLDPRTSAEERVEMVATLSVLDARPSQERWEKLLTDRQPEVRSEAIRNWRAFKQSPEMIKLLTRKAPELAKQNPMAADELTVVLTELNADLKQAGLTRTEPVKDTLAAETLAAMAKLKGGDRNKRARSGRLVFERSACVKCHTSVTRNTPLAPSLKGIANGQKPEYLVESVLYPSKIIKTGFETEQIVTKAGKTLTGLVKDEGKFLRVMNLEGEVRVAKSDIEQRTVQKISLMPEGQEKQLSKQEFLDLMAYLQSLR